MAIGDLWHKICFALRSDSKAGVAQRSSPRIWRNLISENAAVIFHLLELTEIVSRSCKGPEVGPCDDPALSVHNNSRLYLSPAFEELNR